LPEQGVIKGWSIGVNRVEPCEIKIDTAILTASSFGNLPQWLILVRASKLEDGDRVRELEAVGGAVIVERLLSFDEAKRRFSYSRLEAPDPAFGLCG
jgi:hypothetical protein